MKYKSLLIHLLTFQLYFMALPIGIYSSIYISNFFLCLLFGIEILIMIFLLFDPSSTLLAVLYCSETGEIFVTFQNFITFARIFVPNKVNHSHLIIDSLVIGYTPRIIGPANVIYTTSLWQKDLKIASKYPDFSETKNCQ